MCKQWVLAVIVGYDRKAFFYFGQNRNSPKQPFFVSAETDTETENRFLFRPIPKPKQIFIAFSAISGVIFFRELGFPTKIYSNHTKFVFWDCFGVIFVGNITSLKNITPEMAEKTVKMCFGYLPKQKFCFGRYRNRNRKLFYSFGKTEIRPKWPKFGRKPKPNLFRSYTTFNDTDTDT